MPQLDTSMWLTMIMSMIMALFIVLQLKISKHNFYHNPKPTPTEMHKQHTPWETKWTKIYLPLSSSLHF
nr:ATP synthase F0 subunit 8 [Giraffa tippelskirchi tippelskirchi]WNH35468.1 ATP synthase F0 subunit 8 [Giraffa tippelskirchi tippelskirchi]WNH35520.1 ATP synthase F0 subunit 8 [Giraffa tippelskirchi tippelskirchi]WNH35533.1 ATP synthase F0 subunit 8 [Giraffa tippelskirchi tippelskirchi]WNH35559.1 ATP synthase F0 subunit 8 [Giraffa tippelskirchi tippelskirchi]